MKIKIKYCGGCNSGYDRAGLVEKLKADFPLLEFLVTPSGDCRTGFVLAVCGCPVRCAARENETENYGAFTVSSQNDVPGLYRKLKALNVRGGKDEQ